jgi:ATP-dependent 26S proteasome regulatory subunit
MDGLADDADVVFVLTTNRVELLEPALAARPGRIDQAVEIRLPDEECRARLFELYLRGANFSGDDLTDHVAATNGVTASFIKELVRRAVLVAARERADADDVTAPAVTSAHVEAALDDLLHHSAPVLRSSLGANPDVADQLDPFEHDGPTQSAVGGWFAYGSSD